MLVSFPSTYLHTYTDCRISSWVGFEVGLINEQLEIIIARTAAAGEELTITDSAFGIFLQSIKYRYYPIFMLILVVFLIAFQRDFGPMLLAERQVRVYDRTDGGPNKGKADEMEGGEQNQPREDQPLLAWNMLFPVIILVVLIFVALVESGDDGSGTQSFMDKIENSNSYVALLYGVSSKRQQDAIYSRVLGRLSLQTLSTLLSLVSL